MKRVPSILTPCLGYACATPLSILTCVFLLPFQAGAEPFLGIRVDQPIVVFQGTSPTTVTLSAFAEDFHPSTLVWTSQTSRINPLSAKHPAEFSANRSPNLSTVATLPEPGVYQIELTATNGTTTLRRKTWIHVWDNTPVLSPGKIGAYPDVLPPPTVRQLAPDPGPFRHPRLMVTNREWPEISYRNTNGQFASHALRVLKNQVKEHFDAPQCPASRISTELDRWARDGYRGNPACDVPDRKFYEWLHSACYLAWLELDPAKSLTQATPEQRARREFLGRLTAAAARFQFQAQWDRASRTFRTNDPHFINGINKPGESVDAGPYRDLPQCYDLSYAWMTDSQRRDARDFLFAVSYARHYSAAFAWHPTHGAPGLPMNALNQNGDFGNLSDYGILASMAVEGEESAVSPDVRDVFSTPAKDSNAHIWMKPSPPDDPSAWPCSTVGSVDNLHRQFRMLNEGFITPWGFWATMGAYMGLSTSQFLPPTFAMARRGENAFVTSYLYNVAMGDFYTLQRGEGETKSPLYTSNIYNFDHHDGGRAVKPFVYFMLKYMYPDDPLIDYVYRTYIPFMWRWGTSLDEPLMCSMFGMDPGTRGKVLTLPEIAAAKKLPLLKFDPAHTIAISRNGWSEEDLNIWYDCDWSPGSGHQHAEKNSFSLYALGRAWSCPPGYHCTINDLSATILVQSPRDITEPSTNGYIGESPSCLGQLPPRKGNFPTPPAKVLEISESPDKLNTLFAGDATDSYTYGFNGERKIRTGKKVSSYMFPGLTAYLDGLGSFYKDFYDQELSVSQDDFNPVKYAIRSVLLVRGKRPYVICVDDFNKDGTPRNYRWVMNAASGFAAGGDNRFIGPDGKPAYSSMAIMPGCTSREAVLYHSPVDDEKSPGQKGLPRLLVRELGAPAGPAQPPITLESRPPSDGMNAFHYLYYGVDNNSKKPSYIPSNRLIIERQGVIDPHYVVLLFPFRTGETLPQSRWNDKSHSLGIDLGNGESDTITFDRTNPDHRTRLAVTRRKSGN